jgi:hypothetical protein
MTTPISSSNPRAKDIVILQRGNDNQSYGEIHFSGSHLIFYTDASGYMNADKSASFYSLFPPSGFSGSLKDSANNVIADIVGGIIIKTYY